MIERYEVEFDLQIKRAKIWLEKSENLSDEDDIQMFAKFYYLWSAFNSLYNLELDEDESERERIKKILHIIERKNSDLFINDNSEELIKYDEPVRDEKYYFLMKFNRRYREKHRNIKEDKKLNKIYKSPESSFSQRLESVILTIYQIRNNLTHGNKSGDYRDIYLIKNANPILFNLVNILLRKLELK